METTVLLKITIVDTKNGSRVKHIPLGTKLELKEGEVIKSIAFDDIKVIYHTEISKGD